MKDEGGEAYSKSAGSPLFYVSRDQNQLVVVIEIKSMNATIMNDQNNQNDFQKFRPNTVVFESR